MATVDTQGSTGNWWDQNAPSGATSDFPAPSGGWQLAQQSATSGTQQQYSPGDPGTYQAPGGYWFDPSGNMIGVSDYFSPSTPPTTGTTIPGGPTSTGGDPALTFGGPVSPFQFNATDPNAPPIFTPPPLPDSLKNPWTLPTAADVQNTPGYQSRYLQGLDARQRMAASRGTILNGGTAKALDKYGTDYATQAYQDDVNNSLQQRQQQASDYLNLAYGPAWQQNQSAVNQYGQLYNQYKDLTSNNRLAQNDYWQQQMDLLNAGLGAAKAGTPGTAGATAG